MATASPAKFNSDGKSVDVTLTSSVVAGDIAYVEGWLGIMAQGGGSDDTRAMLIDEREYIFDVGAGLAVAKGDTVWVTVNTLTGHLPTLAGWNTASGSNRIRLFRALAAKDANNKVRGRLISGLGLA